MMQSLVSVIVPIYNVGGYLKQCIDSIRCQTYGNLEIILVDDGSTDEGAAICDTYGAMDSRIKVIHKQNGGLVSARKAGLRVANGEYITFVDADDWIDLDACEVILSAAEGSNKPDIVAYGCIEEYGAYSKSITNHVQPALYQGTDLEQIKNSILMDDIFFEWNMLPHLCDKFIKREIIEKCINGVSDSITFGEDAACSFPCMMQAESILVLDVVPYHYRQREGSIVKSGKEIGPENFKPIYNALSQSFYTRKTLMDQLQLYMFFLLLLKSYSFFNLYMPIFPFIEVPAHSKIFLYGAGGFGRVLKNHIEESDALSFAGWTDGRAESLIKEGVPINTIREMLTCEFDYVVVSVLNENISREISKKLEQMGISRKKIVLLRRECLESKYLPDWCRTGI